MTDNDKLVMLKQIYGESESDEVLLTYLNLAKCTILNRLYPFDDTQNIVPDRYANTQITIAVYLLNKRGAEGEIAHNENGINRSYESADVPESMLKDIMPHCGVIG